jgi:hypothetical protein
MLFRDYVELLYQAYLQDKGYIETLRKKIQSEEFNKEQLYDPAFQNWKQINPADRDTSRQRVKYHPSPVDPQQGVYVYEDSDALRHKVEIVK